MNKSMLQSTNKRGSARCRWLPLGLVMLLGSVGADAAAPGDYSDLVVLFGEWRTLERPTFQQGVPDYTAAAMRAKHQEVQKLQARLKAIDPREWPVPQKVDYHLVRAELNGLDFYIRVLKPWARDPAFYASVRASQSDTPAEEGPTLQGAIRLWTYSIWPQHSLSEVKPLSGAEARQLALELRTVPPLLTQARVNLADSDARDLWVGGTRTFQNQVTVLDRLAELTADGGQELRDAIQAARSATADFALWLKAEEGSRSGPSGVGKDNYTWHLQKVLLVPRTWEDEVAMMRQELARAHASLRLEEQLNQGLPPLEPVASPGEFERLQAESISNYIGFLRNNDVLQVEDYYDLALRERVFDYHPEAIRHFFHQATHRDPRTLWTHFYHYWDLAQMQRDPHVSPIRREPLRYNIWMSRSEGMATGMEEWMMKLGLFADNPRAREVVWIMLATRAARGLSSLLAHANEINMEEAGELHVEWTPRGWIRPDQDLLGYEQHLYLRQPGYGTSYLTGARMIEETMALRARQLGDDFTIKGFFDEVNEAGLIPTALLHWELTGDDGPIEKYSAPSVAPIAHQIPEDDHP